MELPDLGKHCSASDCKRLDYLPLMCKCGKYFCSEHFPEHALSCPSIQVIGNEAVVENSETKDSKTFVCSFVGCKSASYVPLLCEKCNKHYCITHRHIVNCSSELDPEMKAAELEKFVTPILKFREAKANVDKQLDASLDLAKKKLKTTALADKVQLMRIKNKATGSKSIPTADRVYFNVSSQSVEGSAQPVFVSKNWSLGKAIDVLAEQCKLDNKNNQNGAAKLTLSHKSNGEVVCMDFSIKISDLLSSRLLTDGEDLMFSV